MKKVLLSLVVVALMSVGTSAAALAASPEAAHGFTHACGSAAGGHNPHCSI